ncbi:N6-adenosine-methyltransferase non-catalytic subunit MTB isoform X2 [Lolium perenne]|nr:N6-adenosine-methyltransferase non-catalytic subunit MTB-like isoform X2 [Lolium perenne]
MSRRDMPVDELEDPGDSRLRSADRNESRRKSVSSSGRAYSGDEDDYDVRRGSRVSKIRRRSPEERSEKRFSDGYKDRDRDSSRRRREDEHDPDSSRRSSSRSSDHGVSHSTSISKAEGPYDGKHAKGIQSLEVRKGSKENQGHRNQEDPFYQRSVDEAYSDRRADGTGSDRSDTRDGSDQSNHRGELRGSLEDDKRGNGYATIESNDQDRLSVDPRCESGSHMFRENKHVSIQERIPSSIDDIERSDDNVETRDKLPCLDEDGRALLKDGNNKEARDDKKYPAAKDEGDRGHLDSYDERSISMKEKTKEYAHADPNSYRGRDKNRELEGSKEYSRNRQRQDSKEATDYDAVTDRRHGQERLDGGNFHSRPGYRKDLRGRYEGNKGPLSYGNRYDSSDSIEIRPNRNLDFGRESPVSVRRSDMGSHQDLMPGTNDPSEDNKKSYGSGEDLQERYYEDAQNIDNDTANDQSDSQTGRRGLKGAMTPNTSGAVESGSGSRISPIPQQGPKGGRPSRGLRGRPIGRDPQRVGISVPMMPPSPFGPLGLPPGPMQPMGPNMSHSPGPLGHGVFMPPFPGPLIWPGARGVDMSMLALPPNLPMPLQNFTTSVGAGPNHNIHMHQTDTGRGLASGSGFNPMATPSREIMHDKPPAGWTPQRNSGSAGKAPSRGEQNDYSQNFVDTGMRPQNFIRELELTNVVEDYPKLRELIQRKDEIVSNSASALMYYKCDLMEHALSPDFFGTKFDVILVDPPWEEYVHRAPGITDDIEYWTPEEIMNLKIEAIADTPSFIFLWVGDGVGLEQGRQCLKKWGFRRCEDICWVKTNKKNATPGLRHDSNTLFQHSKEHCLMGIKGTVRRSTDGHIIHANIDTDIIIAEEPTDGSTKKPEDMYRIIEHFALGMRRLELFGEDHNIRPGWLTLGKALSSSNFNKEAYLKNITDRDGKVWQSNGGRNPPPDAPHLVVTTPEIESLRPKSPPHKNQQHQSISVPLGSSTNRRSGVSTPQNAVTVVGSETVMPPGWSSTPMAGFANAGGRSWS